MIQFFRTPILINEESRENSTVVPDTMSAIQYTNPFNHPPSRAEYKELESMTPDYWELTSTLVSTQMQARELSAQRTFTGPYRIKRNKARPKEGGFIQQKFNQN